jgi:hypothetical protein
MVTEHFVTFEIPVEPAAAPGGVQLLLAGAGLRIVLRVVLWIMLWVMLRD